MGDREKYNYDDFTQEYYKKLIQLAKEKFKFSSYNDFDKEDTFILWRHDVDFSLYSALQLAEIERDEDVPTTYFLHLHSEFYNLLEKESVELVQQIIDYGHHIGLHFDSHFYGVADEEELIKKLRYERQLLQDLLHNSIDTFSFHNPDDTTSKFRNFTYAGMVNTYAGYFRSEVAYGSDSNGYWRHEPISAMIASSHSRLQILTHPAWWQKEVMSPKERIWKCINDSASRTKEKYLKTLKDSGRIVVG